MKMTRVDSSCEISICIFLLSLLVRWITSLYSYSGQSKPPMFGDFEAQRHWMEITVNLKAAEWYSNSSSNDLGYWGLDYPPLTAYHSYIMGLVANNVNPKFVELYESRGIETVEHKLFMRFTVLISDLICFYTSSLLLVNRLAPKNQQNARHLSTLALVLLSPSLILIDHGHFQYNSVSLGLAQFAISFLISKNSRQLPVATLISGAFWFSTALNFKQMELYHALPFFFYLLGVCLGNKNEAYWYRLFKLACVGLTVIGTFVILWLPFLVEGLQSTLQVLTRLFPFSRGLFEDKVANFWCSLSVVYKLRERLTIESLSKLALLVTGLLNLPSGLDLLLRPTRERFLLSLINSSLVFYLFSFQVHEKSILLAIVPACLLVGKFPFFVTWFTLITNLSMLPLLYKDGLTSACFSLTCMFGLIAYANSPDFWPVFELKNFKFTSQLSSLIQAFLKFTFLASFLGSLVLAYCFLFVPAPSHLPDLWTVCICVYSCIHFILFCVMFHLAQFSLNSIETYDKQFDFNCCFRQVNLIKTNSLKDK